MKFIDITDKVKHIGETIPKKIEASTISEKPTMFVNSQQDRKSLEEVYKYI